MKTKNIFQKIIQKEENAKIIYQDSLVTAFEDIKPKAPVHILIVPNKFIKCSDDINEKNKKYFHHMFDIALKLSKKLKINTSGYRIVLNCNKDAGQEVQYLHIHLLGGKKLRKI